MKTIFKYTLLAALLPVVSPLATAGSSYDLAKLVAKSVQASPEDVLQIVKEQISKNEGAACEIVKAAIVAAESSKSEVASIVRVAAKVIPAKASLLATCAVSVAPDAYEEIASLAVLGLSASEFKQGAFKKNLPNPLSFVGLNSIKGVSSAAPSSSTPSASSARVLLSPATFTLPVVSAPLAIPAAGSQ